MTPEERADLNRRAAELAGWRFEVRPAPGDAGEWWPIGISPDGEKVWPTSDPCPSREDAEWYLPRIAPDFCGSPALWWPLVERFAGLLAARNGTWEGPNFLLEAPGWAVDWLIPGGDGGLVYEAEAGIAACRAAVAVAAALGPT